MVLRSGARDRVCFVHVGTHKTGTTAIQRFLAANEAALASAGTAYPRAGRLSPAYPGHHNLAFELNGDPRFDASLGTLGDVIAEVTGAERVCLSSEDFEYLHARPALLIALRNAIASAGYRPVIVIYLRAQAEYLESLYAEDVKHGGVLSFEGFAAGILKRGVHRYPNGLGLAFEYTRLVGPFAAVFGLDSVIVREYTRAESAFAFVRDFVRLIDGAHDAETFDAPDAYEHTRPSVGDVIRWLGANTAKAYRSDEPLALADRYASNEDAPRPFAALSRARRDAVAARFAADNAVLGAHWKLSALTPAGRVAERSFSEPANRLFARAEAARADFIERRTTAPRFASASGGQYRPVIGGPPIGAR
jgi:hypothetical protein